MTSPLVKGAATTLILLLLKEEPTHGYQLVQAIKARSRGTFSFSEGTIYPLLYDLVERGSIKGEWVAGTGARRRRVYSLTAKGRAQLGRRLDEWTQFERGMRWAIQGGTA